MSEVRSRDYADDDRARLGGLIAPSPSTRRSAMNATVLSTEKMRAFEV